jgi:hypothetical protein
MMHLVGLSLDGRRGVSVITYARETLGLALSTEQYAALQFGRAPRPAGVLRHPGVLGAEAAGNLARSFERAHTGPQNWQKVAVLEEGVEFQQIGISSKDAQYLESRQFQVPEIARWFRMPLHKIQELTRATFSNIEQQSIEYVTDTLQPWLVNLEQVFTRDLIVATQTYFAEFEIKGLLRGDAAARSDFYNKGVFAGWLTRNEVRIAESLNPLPGLDQPLTPANVTGKQPAQPAPAEPDDDDPDESDASASEPAARLALPLAAPAVVAAPATPVAAPMSPRLVAIVTEAAGRLARKESAALRKGAQRHASDPAGWSAWLKAFYAEHAVCIADTLKLSLPVAQTYIAAQLARLEAGTLAEIDASDFERAATNELALAALKAEEAA